MKKDIEVLDVITLDDGNKYMVSGATKYEEKDYLIIIDIKDNKNIKTVQKIAVDDGFRLRVVTDEDFAAKLRLLFMKNNLEKLQELKLDDFKNNN